MLASTRRQMRKIKNTPDKNALVQNWIRLSLQSYGRMYSI